MGVYLSTPNTELEAEDGHDSKLVFGAASMQGWRVGQEDAHIAVLDYDTDISLFGVFDGHGGQEVAKYCAQHLPGFIKSLNSYQKNKLSDCLEEAFLKFDQTLTQPEVINELKILSGNQEMDKEDTDDEINEAILLREEADIPIEALMARYTNPSAEVAAEPDSECSSSSSTRLRLPLPSHLRNEMKDKSKSVSPYLRAKRSVISELKEPTEECSSSSASTDICANVPNSEVSNSESHSTSQPDSTNKIDSESNEVSVTPSDETKAPTVSNGELSTNDSADCLPTSSITDGLTSDDNPIKSDINSDSNCEANEANSKITSPSLPYKGKGKHKKIITPKTLVPTSTTADASEETEKPIYKYFLEDFDGSDDSSDESENEFEGNDESSDDEEDNEDDDISDEDSEEEEESEPSSGALCYERPGYDSGCTAVVALLRGDQLFVANAGDSRCVVSRDGKAVEMSIDHKPEDEIERKRVEKAGGKVTLDGRVNGGLNLSRAIGDHAYKKNKRVSDRDQMITALPDIKTLDLKQPNDQFMVIACDGIWNSFTSQQVIDFVAKRIETADKLSSICDELFKSCLASNTHGDGTGCDNMTAVIVKFVDINRKRKLEEETDNGVNNDLPVESGDKRSDSSEEPKPKRIKINDFENEEKPVIETQTNV